MRDGPPSMSLASAAVAHGRANAPGQSWHACRAELPEPEDGRASSPWLIAALLALVAAIPRFAWLTSPLPGLDETWSWYHVGLMLAAGDYWKQAGIGMDAPLFSAINLGMARTLGHDVWPMRLPPAVFGTLAVPLFYLIVRRLADERLARRAALLMAASPFFIYYAKEARPYSQLLFACLLFTWAFFTTGTCALSFPHPISRNARGVGTGSRERERQQFADGGVQLLRARRARRAHGRGSMGWVLQCDFARRSRGAISRSHARIPVSNLRRAAGDTRGDPHYLGVSVSGEPVARAIERSGGTVLIQELVRCQSKHGSRADTAAIARASPPPQARFNLAHFPANPVELRRPPAAPARGSWQVAFRRRPWSRGRGDGPPGAIA